MTAEYFSLIAFIECPFSCFSSPCLPRILSMTSNYSHTYPQKILLTPTFYVYSMNKTCSFPVFSPLSNLRLSIYVGEMKELAK